MYYNTVNYKDEQLSIIDELTNTKDQQILQIAKILQQFTASEILNYMHSGKHGYKPPITSIRRSLNTLSAKKGLIIKTQNTRLSMYGRPEHVYKVIN